MHTVEVFSSGRPAAQQRTASSSSRRSLRLVRKLIAKKGELLQSAASVVLMAIALLVFSYTTVHLIRTLPRKPIADVAVTAVSGVMFAIIIMEIKRTVLDESGLKLKPFLTLGIISSVREVLTVGAKLSLQGDKAPTATIHNELLEMGVNTAVVLGLVCSLVLIRWMDGRSFEGCTPKGIVPPQPKARATDFVAR
jgi:uncharacterized membrane protein (DUF373 family)